MVIVTGLGRCGSSLVMQMLDAAGIECAGNAPYFEDARAKPSNLDREWLKDQKCVKILALHLADLPKDSYKIIYLTRDDKVQAESQQKFFRLLHGRNEKKPVIVSRIRKQSKLLQAKCKTLGPVLHLKFEDFQDRPELNIAKLCQYLNLDPEVVSVPMYNCIVRRPNICMPDMQVEEML